MFEIRPAAEGAQTPAGFSGGADTEGFSSVGSAGFSAAGVLVGFGAVTSSAGDSGDTDLTGFHPRLTLIPPYYQIPQKQ
jgi:hypothetical protein